MGCPKGDRVSQDSKGSPASLPVEKLKPVEKPAVEKSKKGDVPSATKKLKSQGGLTRSEMIEGLKRSPKKGEKLEKEKEIPVSLFKKPSRRFVKR